MAYFIDYDEYIFLKPNSISNDVCDYLIDLFEKDEKKTVYDGLSGVGLNTNIKKTRDMKLTKDINKYDNLLCEEVSLCIDHFFKGEKCVKVLPYLNNLLDTGYQLQKYKANEGYYMYHHDSQYEIFNNNVKTRVLTFIWYLNTVESGGETEFFNGRIKVKPEKGKLLIFPATWTYMHKGNIPLSSDKYIVTGWIYSDIWYRKKVN